MSASHHGEEHHEEAGHEDTGHEEASSGEGLGDSIGQASDHDDPEETRDDHGSHEGEHSESEAHGQSEDHGEHHEGGHGSMHAGRAPPLWTVAPFVMLLLSIAVLPLIPATEHWWESNASRFKVAAGLGALTLCYYGFLHEGAIEGHWPAHKTVEPTGAAFETGLVQTILENAVMQEFVPFIVLLFSLYTISGGIRISGDLQAKPDDQRHLHGGWRHARELHRHNRRRDVVDPSALGDQSRTESMSSTRWCSLSSLSATAAAACCRSETRRCSWGISAAFRSFGRSSCGSLG